MNQELQNALEEIKEQRKEIMYLRNDLAAAEGRYKRLKTSYDWLKDLAKQAGVAA